MQKNIFFIIAAIIIGFSAYFLGLQAGRYEGWIKASEPPSPNISVGNQTVTAVLSGYSWCERSLFSIETKCVATDSMGGRELLEQGLIEPVLAKSGELIVIEYKEEYLSSIRELTLKLMENNNEEIDPYIVPAEPGIYLYEIYTQWGNRQGDSSHFFAIKVE